MGKGDKRRPEDIESFSEGYDRIFGNKKAVRGSFVWDESQKKFVEKSDYYGETNAPYIQADIQPYKSMVTGEVIQGRSQHRAHLKSHGLIEVGNETKYISQNATPKADPKLKRMIAEITDHHWRRGK